MADLGMTHGGFYAHFTDKEALVTASCEYAFSAMLKNWDQLQPTGGTPFAARVRDYLSRQHVDHPENGCFAAALAGEMARRDTRSRQAFSHGIEQMLLRLAEEDGRPANLAPEAVLSMMLGAVMLARAVSDRQLSERFRQLAVSALTGAEPDQP